MIIGISGKKGAGKDLTADLINEILQERKSIQFIRKKFADKLKDIVCLILGCTREQLEDRDYKEKELGPEWNLYHAGFHNESCIFSTQEEQQEFLSANSGAVSVWQPHLTPRLLLQLLGTECGKEIIHPKIWINSLMSDYKGYELKAHSGSVLDENCYRHTKCQKCGSSYFGFKRQYFCKECIDLLNPMYPPWLITDVRFPDEVESIRQKQGIVIRINRHFDIIRYEEAVKEFHKGSPVFILYPDGSESLIENLDTLDYYLKDSSVKFGFERNFDTHKSETSLDDYKNFDYVIENDGSIEDLKIKLENILIELKLI